MSTKHSKAAEVFLEDRNHASWHNEALWFVREKRDKIIKDIPEWEELRELSSKIKLHTVSHLDSYLEQFTKNAEANGVIVHWAIDAKEHNEIVCEILTKNKVKKVVKSVQKV
jgi:L-lactate dehydrogenase complex protein LldF